ncbi:hypothetical protein B5K06_27745 [Rhizobium grahamii]|uniref:Uncharacterized protein n=1 Tax=Rhizobium grahamii TaxID=1120045 RepID=A0A370KH45_9HYPH|nr:hypothetical protein B5K06_27745 [Rhizobium grahamii]
MENASSESFGFGLAALLKLHPDLQDQAHLATRWTELIEAYGDALRLRDDLRTKGGDSMLLEHFEQTCRELEDDLQESLRSCRRTCR